MEYKVIYASTPNDMTESINRYLAAGWQLYGNFVLTEKGGLIQALIRIKE